MFLDSRDFTAIKDVVKTYLSGFSRNSDKSKPIIVIAGTTATGKSSTAIKLAKLFNGYIINADSQQIYRELKIGTAQPKPDTIDSTSKLPSDCWNINGVKHYLYGHHSITESERYNLVLYKSEVEKILEYKHKKSPKQIPILVGGTGLYIDAVIYNYQFTTINSKSNSSKQTSSETNLTRVILEKKSVKELQEMIGSNISLLNRSDRLNPHRLIRFIEREYKKPTCETPLEHLYLVLTLPKEELNKRIIQRVKKMFDYGLLEENISIRSLTERSLTQKMEISEKLVKKEKKFLTKNKYKKKKVQIKKRIRSTNLTSIGYQEFDLFFDGKSSLEKVEKDIILHTNQYAKRQTTWFKKKTGRKTHSLTT